MIPNCGKQVSDNHVVPKAFYHSYGSVISASSELEIPEQSIPTGLYGKFVCRDCDNAHSPLEQRVKNETKMAHPELLPLSLDGKHRILTCSNFKDYITFSALIIWRSINCEREEVDRIKSEASVNLRKTLHDAFTLGNLGALNQLHVTAVHLDNTPDMESMPYEVIEPPVAEFISYKNCGFDYHRAGYVFSINTMEFRLHDNAMEFPEALKAMEFNSSNKIYLPSVDFFKTATSKRHLNVIHGGYRRDSLTREEEIEIYRRRSAGKA